MNRTYRLSGGRPAFTLVEVLVVIGIIGLLTTIIIVAIGPSLENAKIGSTKTTIAQLNSIVQDRVNAITRLDVASDARKLASNLNVTVEQAEFIIRKNLYRQALPQSQQDLLGFDQNDDTPTADKFEKEMCGNLTASAVTAWIAKARSLQFDDSYFWPNWAVKFDFCATPAESYTAFVERTTNAQVFLFAVTEISSVRAFAGSKSYQVPVMDIASINPAHVFQPASLTGREVGLLSPPAYFIDAWGQPINFYPWPTGLVGTTAIDSMMKSVPSDAATRDPDDPKGTSSGAFASDKSLSGHTISLFGPANYHHVDHYYTPLIVSSGPDEALGLNAQAQTGAARLAQPSGALEGVFDNITNRQQ